MLLFRAAALALSCYALGSLTYAFLPNEGQLFSMERKRSTVPRRGRIQPTTYCTVYGQLA